MIYQQDIKYFNKNIKKFKLKKLKIKIIEKNFFIIFLIIFGIINN